MSAGGEHVDKIDTSHDERPHHGHVAPEHLETLAHVTTEMDAIELTTTSYIVLGLLSFSAEATPL